MPDQPNYVSTREAAKILGTYQKKVQRLIKQGELMAFRSGGARGYNVSLDSIAEYQKRQQAAKGD